MGCHEPGSNFNALYYMEGRGWGYVWGDLEFTNAPTREILVEGIQEFTTRPVEEWIISQDPQSGMWKAVKPATVTA